MRRKILLTPGLNRGGNVDNGFSIQNIVDAQPRSECGRKTTVVVAGPRSTTHRGDSSCARGARWRAPFDMMVWYAWGFGCSLSLSVEEGICLSLALWQESGPNFKRLLKVSGVATNHWVFLRCDLLPVSS